MQWNSDLNAGFTSGTPWLPVNTNYETVNVEAQRGNPSSHLEIYKTAVSWRNSQPAFQVSCGIGQRSVGKASPCML